MKIWGGASVDGEYVLKTAKTTANFLEDEMIAWIEDFDIEGLTGVRLLLYFSERDMPYQLSEVEVENRPDGLQDFYLAGVDDEWPDKVAVVSEPDLEEEDHGWATEIDGELHPDDGEGVLAYDEEEGLHLREFHFDAEYPTGSAQPISTQTWFEPKSDNTYDYDPDAWVSIPAPESEEELK